MGTTIISAKLAKRIIAKISELVGSSIEEKVKGHIETKRTELFIKNYQKKLEEELLEDYGNEIIYLASFSFPVNPSAVHLNSAIFSAGQRFQKSL